MTLRSMRTFSIGIALMGCSTDTIVVATLDGSAGAASGGTDAGASGTHTEESASGGVAGESGTNGAGGVAERLGGTAGTARGGSAGSVTQLQGLPTTTICTCIGSESFVCGADGVTYDSACPNGCSQVVVMCLHACPCDTDTGDGGAPSVAEWFDSSCLDPGLCPAGSLCFSAEQMTPPPACP